MNSDVVGEVLRDRAGGAPLASHHLRFSRFPLGCVQVENKEGRNLGRPHSPILGPTSDERTRVNARSAGRPSLVLRRGAPKVDGGRTDLGRSGAPRDLRAMADAKINVGTQGEPGAQTTVEAPDREARGTSLNQAKVGPAGVIGESTRPCRSPGTSSPNSRRMVGVTSMSCMSAMGPPGSIPGPAAIKRPS